MLRGRVAKANMENQTPEVGATRIFMVKKAMMLCVKQTKIEEI